MTSSRVTGLALALRIEAAEAALGLPTLYASGRAGIASTTEPRIERIFQRG